MDDVAKMAVGFVLLIVILMVPLVVLENKKLNIMSANGCTSTVVVK